MISYSIHTCTHKFVKYEYMTFHHLCTICIYCIVISSASKLLMNDRDYGLICFMLVFIFTQWLFVLEQYAEFGLLFVLQWEYFLQLLEKYSYFSISIILL